MKIGDVAAIIEEFAPLSLQESYDNAGLVVGRPEAELQGGILLAVDVTEEVIAEAVELGFNMVVTHHPIVFHPLKKFNSSSVAERCVEAAIRNGIALYAAHTNLDSARDGMSWRLGEMLGLQQMSLLEPFGDGRVDAGFGVIGTLAGPLPVEEFLANLRKTLDVSVVKHSAVVSETVSRVAVCTGSGGSLMEAARASGCDVYVTADLRYNDFFAPAGGFMVADVGHFESEKCSIRILFDILSKKITTFALRESARAKNPVHYSM